jgi:hypothetical protein
MQKLNILLWVSCLFWAVSCKHEQEQTPETNLQLSFSTTSCYDGDTIMISAYVNGTPYTGELNWNGAVIEHSGYSYSAITPLIYTDSTSLLITAQLGTQKISQVIRIKKRALSKPIVSYLNTIQPLLNSNCNFSGCHGNGSRAGKVELSCYDSTLKSVAPYNANASLLYIAMVKTDPLRVMPPAGKLHDDKIEHVKTWIEQGAGKN